MCTRTQTHKPIQRPSVQDHPGEPAPERQNQSGSHWSTRQRVAVASARPHASLHLTPDRQPRQHPTTQPPTGRTPFLPSNQQRQSTEGKNVHTYYARNITTLLQLNRSRSMTPLSDRISIPPYCKIIPKQRYMRTAPKHCDWPTKCPRDH